jgi:tRNA 2-selenouridine synthase SelU
MSNGNVRLIPLNDEEVNLILSSLDKRSKHLVRVVNHAKTRGENTEQMTITFRRCVDLQFKLREIRRATRSGDGSRSE